MSTTWVCPVCGTNNSIKDKVCLVCDSPRVVSGEVSKELGLPKTQKVDGTMASGTPWVCRECGHNNYATAIICEVCEADRPKDVHLPTSTVAGSSGDSGAVGRKKTHSTSTTTAPTMPTPASTSASTLSSAGVSTSTPTTYTTAISHKRSMAKPRIKNKVLIVIINIVMAVLGLVLVGLGYNNILDATPFVYDIFATIIVVGCVLMAIFSDDGDGMMRWSNVAVATLTLPSIVLINVSRMDGLGGADESLACGWIYLAIGTVYAIYLVLTAEYIVSEIFYHDRGNVTRIVSVIGLWTSLIVMVGIVYGSMGAIVPELPAYVLVIVGSATLSLINIAFNVENRDGLASYLVSIIYALTLILALTLAICMAKYEWEMEVDKQVWLMGMVTGAVVVASSSALYINTPKCYGMTRILPIIVTLLLVAMEVLMFIIGDEIIFLFINGVSIPLFGFFLYMFKVLKSAYVKRKGLRMTTTVVMMILNLAITAITLFRCFMLHI